MTRGRRFLKWFKYLTLTLLCGLCLLTIGVSGVLYHYYSQRPALSSIFKSYGNPESTNNKLLGAETRSNNLSYLDSEGKVFYQSDLNHVPIMSVSATKKSTNVIDALISVEDRQFFKEHGVNWGHTFKAGLDTYLKRDVSGGSTITQQLIKLSFFSTSREDQTIKRKTQEIALAREMSKRFSKYQILTWYLNKTNYSNGVQGMAYAAQQYYRKKPQDLSMLQAATLVGIVNSPREYNLYANPQAVLKRRNIVIDAMYTNNKISRQQAQDMKQQPITTGLVSADQNEQTRSIQANNQARYNGFVSGVNAQLSRYDSKFLEQSGKIQTTMNKQLQDEVDQIVANQKFPDKKMQEAIAVLDNRDGNVVAMSGGRSGSVMNGFNRAYAMKRSSGSSIKPLLDYGPAFDLFNWNAHTIVDDSPYVYPDTNKRVHDWDRLYQGPITVQQALVESRNIPAIKALVKVGRQRGLMALSSLGLPNQNLFYANGIGVDTNPLAMASAYSSLANGGQRSNARFLTSMTNSANGKVLKTKTVHEQVFTPQTSYLLTNVLKHVFTSPRATGKSARVVGIHEAGKTGTVSRNGTAEVLTDGWMIGYTKSYTVAVWIGYENPKDPNHYLTNKTSLISNELYKSVMTKASQLSTADNSNWSAPSGVSEKQQKLTHITPVGEKNNFLQTSNSKYPYVPFYINMLPEQFLNSDELTASYVSSVYKSVNAQYDGR